MTLWIRAGARPKTTWTPYAVKLSEDAGWQVEGEDRAPTRLEMKRVLASLVALRIRGEYRIGDDECWMREVSLTSSPGAHELRARRPDLLIEWMAAEAVRTAESDSERGTWTISAGVGNRARVALQSPFEVWLESSVDGVRFDRVGSAKKLDEFGSLRSSSVFWVVRQARGSARGDLLPKGTQWLRVRADATEVIEERSEWNNTRDLVLAGCGEKRQWLEVPTLRGSRSTRATNRALARTRPDYAYLTQDIRNTAQRVHCYIKLEAQRRGMVSPGTVAGSRFATVLDKWMKPYWDRPSKETALEVIETISKPQYWLVSPKKMVIPSALRRIYPGVPEGYLYPATHLFTNGLFEEGDHVDTLPCVDVPFLLGEDRRAKHPDMVDFEIGGHNLSHSMHWGTGLRYHAVNPHALRDLFLGYEIWHLEGWDGFGEDSINDLIVEEQGLILGRELVKATMRTRDDLVAACDEAFLRARAWVGKVLALRERELDAFCMAETAPKCNYWWSGTYFYAFPFREERATLPLLVAALAKDHKTPDAQFRAAIKTSFVEDLIGVYRLIREAETYNERRKPGRNVELTPITRDLARGLYDHQFAKASNGWEDDWGWDPNDKASAAGR